MGCNNQEENPFQGEQDISVGGGGAIPRGVSDVFLGGQTISTCRWQAISHGYTVTSIF